MSEALRIVGELEIGKLSLTPGDVLVVKVDSRITDQIAGRIRESVQPFLPDGVRCLVIDSLVDLVVMTRGDIAERTAA